MLYDYVSSRLIRMVIVPTYPMIAPSSCEQIDQCPPCPHLLARPKPSIWLLNSPSTLYHTTRGSTMALPFI